MSDQVNLSKRMPRGAIPSSRHELAAATPYVQNAAAVVPSSFLAWPVGLSYWGNNEYGDCVSAEEAFAKATAKPQVLISEDTVIAWATKNDYLNGAVLTSVMTTLQTQGLANSGQIYCNGPYQSVDWSKDVVLQSAIYSNGPVKLGVGAEAFQDNANGAVTPGECGWTMYNYPTGESEDHCVSLCGYGTLAELTALFQQRGVTVHAAAGMPTGLCYAMFTWNSVGIIDRQSMLNMTGEAWVRSPVTAVSPVYLTTQGNDGLYTVDLPSEAMPVQIVSTQGLGFNDMVQVGNTLYLTTQGSDGIYTFDLASQTRPVQFPSTKGLGFNGVIYLGDTLYLTTQGSDGIYTFDLATPQAEPVQIASTKGLGFSSVINQGNTLYLTTHGSDGIYTFDLVSQVRPVQIASTAGLGFKDMVQVGDTLYLTTQGSDGIYTFDLTTQAKPVQIASTEGLGFNDMVQVGNTTLYLTTHGGDGIYIFDLGTQTKPVQVASSKGLGFGDILAT